MEFSDLTTELGTQMIAYARKVLKTYLSDGQILPPFFKSPILQENAGIFCTIKKNGLLRGCIGYPSPVYPLGEALVKSTIQSAVKDPRFYPLNKNELMEAYIELTVLTPPVLLEANPVDYIQHIVIGRDGLIIQSPDNHRGLLLPQVPIEQNWSVTKFLEHTCIKAGLPSNSWKNDNIKLFTFKGKIFKENHN